ncbi:hypothetical protein PR048_014849 [Dryococelus australis]|uniref:Uncharacterized protein n=1 Tax=Dryococelus australis TaxID=614101 RepID=A0ABQ9HFG3_9NEOP|nr:hypothetical protein PR048_014849 [Dryococelus australis]
MCALVHVPQFLANERYRYLLYDHVHPFTRLQYSAGNLHPQQDDVSAHRSRVVAEWLDRHSTTLRSLAWLPRSPELSPTKHIWDTVERDVCAVDLTLADLRALREAAGMKQRRNDGVKETGAPPGNLDDDNNVRHGPYKNPSGGKPEFKPLSHLRIAWQRLKSEIKYNQLDFVLLDYPREESDVVRRGVREVKGERHLQQEKEGKGTAIRRAVMKRKASKATGLLGYSGSEPHGNSGLRAVRVLRGLAWSVRKYDYSILFTTSKHCGEEISTALYIEVLRADEGDWDPRENPPTNGVVRHDSHMRKSGVPGRGLNPDRFGESKSAISHGLSMPGDTFLTKANDCGPDYVNNDIRVGGHKQEQDKAACAELPGISQGTPTHKKQVCPHNMLCAIKVLRATEMPQRTYILYDYLSSAEIFSLSGKIQSRKCKYVCASNSTQVSAIAVFVTDTARRRCQIRCSSKEVRSQCITIVIPRTLPKIETGHTINRVRGLCETRRKCMETVKFLSNYSLRHACVDGFDQLRKLLKVMRIWRRHCTRDTAQFLCQQLYTRTGAGVLVSCGLIDKGDSEGQEATGNIEGWARALYLSNKSAGDKRLACRTSLTTALQTRATTQHNTLRRNASVVHSIHSHTIKL